MQFAKDLIEKQDSKDARQVSEEEKTTTSLYLSQENEMRKYMIHQCKTCEHGRYLV